MARHLSSDDAVRRPCSQAELDAALLNMRLALVRHLGLPDDYAYMVPSPPPRLARIIDLPDPEVERRRRAMKRLGWGDDQGSEPPRPAS
jgi:hypothetical protein